MLAMNSGRYVVYYKGADGVMQSVTLPEGTTMAEAKARDAELCGVPVDETTTPGIPDVQFEVQQPVEYLDTVQFDGSQDILVATPEYPSAPSRLNLLMDIIAEPHPVRGEDGWQPMSSTLPLKMTQAEKAGYQAWADELGVPLSALAKAALELACRECATKTPE